MIQLLSKYTIPAALSLLPPKMDSTGAKVMLLAIALQESRLIFRRQVNGPARSLLQFEEGIPAQQSGVAGVRIHPRVYRYYRELLTKLLYKETISDFEVHRIIEHNDILAFAIGRLLLWTLPSPLPKKFEYDLSWGQYIAAWNPGKPHRKTWNAYYDLAWETFEKRDLETRPEMRNLEG